MCIASLKVNLPYSSQHDNFLDNKSPILAGSEKPLVPLSVKSSSDLGSNPSTPAPIVRGS